MLNNDLNIKENFLPNISEKTRDLNNLLLSTSWADVEFDQPEFKNGLYLNNQNLSTSQNEILRLFIELVPEWIRVLGCKQHKTHSFCLDIHILLVIKKIMEQEGFKKLDTFYKLILLWGDLLHDIEKNENVVDPDHPLKGAEKSRQILTRLRFDDYFVKNVYALVRYHPLIGFLAIDKLNLNISDITEKIGDEKMVELFVMFSIADIKAVKNNDAFYNENINNNINHIHSEIIKYYRKTAD